MSNLKPESIFKASWRQNVPFQTVVAVRSLRSARDWGLLRPSPPLATRSSTRTERSSTALLSSPGPVSRPPILPTSPPIPTNVQIDDGILYVQLVPTTNADTAAVYTVQFTSLGVTQFSEAWAVPPPSILPFASARRAAGPWIDKRIGARGSHHHYASPTSPACRAPSTCARRWELPLASPDRR